MELADQSTNPDLTIEPESEEINLDEEEEISECIMSIFWASGKLGVAYYDQKTTEMFMMGDIRETENFTILRRVLREVNLVNVITNAKVDDKVYTVIQETLEEITSGDMPAGFLQPLPTTNFNLETSKQMIMSLTLPEIPSHFTEAERTLSMSALIAFDNVCMVRAMGALIKFLERHRVGHQLEHAGAHIPVAGLHTFTLEGLLHIDEHTYSGLQIFQTRPREASTSRGSRTGLSLYKILNRCCSSMGTKLLRLWLTHPLCDVDVLSERQDAVAFFANPRNVLVITELQKCIKHTKDLTRIIRRMMALQLTVINWRTLYETIYNAVHIAEICQTHNCPIAIFQKINNKFTKELTKMANLISKIVDFEESAVQNKFVVKHGVDEELDDKKRTYNGLPEFMTRVAREELSRLSDEITHCNVVYLPQLGYLLSIPETESMRETNDHNIPGLEFVFDTNGDVHYRSPNTRELDRMLGDTQCDITDYERGVMHKLQNVILEHCQVLRDITSCVGELDCLISLGVCARESNYIRPKLNNTNVLEIKGGRHPLQELCCSPFVPNDLSSGGQHCRVKILTGPNASGKSVYLKQVGLIVFMAQVGSFVPADWAEIGVVDGIHSRIKSLESASVGLSTFKIDLNQVCAAATYATGRSLVLLDEFGKGTDVASGKAYLCGVVSTWLDRGEYSPHTLVSTHFHDLPALIPPGPQLDYQTMDVISQGDGLVFLYQLKSGSSVTHSYAAFVAGQAGLPQEIVKRGTEVTELMKKGAPIHRIDTTDAQSQYSRCERIVERFMTLALDHDDVQGFLTDFVLPVYQGREPQDQPHQ